jgi:hypothetical protein
MHRLGKAFVFAFAFAASIAAMPAVAATITVGVVPQIDENLVSTGDTGNPVTALTSPSAFEISISGTENLVTPAAGLQLIVSAADGGFSTLTFSLANPTSTFSTLILNLDVSADGTVTFTDDVSGTSSPFALDDNGSNFFTITGGPFSSISFTTFVNGSEAAILSEVENVRLGGVTLANPSGVPEPGSWALMLLGFGIAGLALRKRKTARVSAGA